LPATIKLSLAKEMSRQVDWSSDPLCAEDEGGVVGCDDVAVGELVCVSDGLADGVCCDVESDDDVLFEHPAVITATATIPAIVNRFSRTGRSFVREDPIMLQAPYPQQACSTQWCPAAERSVWAGGAASDHAVREVAGVNMGGLELYLARRLTDAKTKTQVMRCLNRYIAREIFRALQPSRRAMEFVA
jgi:hypothetical protein